jgi:hypothetical protein
MSFGRDGGTAAVAALTGASWQTVANGKADLDSGDVPPAGRGPQAADGVRSGLLEALESLVRDAMRGDPESPLVWTTRSTEHLAGALTAGHPCSDSTVLRVMKRAGYTQQPDSRAQEGRQHPERDGQFRHIAARAGECLAAAPPVISVDSKKGDRSGTTGRTAASGVGQRARHGALP